LHILANFKVTNAERSIGADATEEVFLISQADFDSVDVHSLTLALMNVLPHKKVWVVPNVPPWEGEII
jgi:hypothetical protein